MHLTEKAFARFAGYNDTIKLQIQTSRTGNSRSLWNKKTSVSAGFRVIGLVVNWPSVIRLGLGQFLCFAYVSMVSRVAIFRGIRFV